MSLKFWETDFFIGYIHPALGYAPVVLEIFLLFLIIYTLLYSLRGTRGSNMLLGLAFVLVFFTGAVRALNFEVLSWLASAVLMAVPTLLIVIFQPELRRAFAHIGTNPFSQRVKQKEVITEIVTAVDNMARTRTGALIVFEGKIGMRQLINEAVRLDCRVTSLLLESIFFPNSPLHDGATVIRNDRIVAARVILPLSRDENLSRTMGTRHRAALGISEDTDAVVIIVSEETGSVSLAYRSGIQRELSVNDLEKRLYELLLQQRSLSETLLGFDPESTSGTPAAKVAKDE